MLYGKNLTATGRKGTCPMMDKCDFYHQCSGIPCQCQCLPNLEAFLKHEINRTKQCACAQCEYERQMYRGLQYVIEAYKSLLEKEAARNKRGEK